MEATKIKSIKIMGKFYQMSKKLIRRYDNIKRLTIIGKWGYLSEMIVKRSINMRENRTMT